MIDNKNMEYTTRFLVLTTLFISLFSFSTSMAVPVSADEQRDGRADFYLLIDNSLSMKDTLNTNLQWLDSEVLKTVVQTGDTVSIYTLAGTAALISETTIQSDEDISALSSVLLAIQTQDKKADLFGGLQIARKQEAQRVNRLEVACVFLAGISGMNDTEHESALLDMMKYSRSVQASNMRIFIVGLQNIEQRLQEAMKNH